MTVAIDELMLLGFVGLRCIATMYAVAGCVLTGCVLLVQVLLLLLMVLQLLMVVLLLLLLLLHVEVVVLLLQIGVVLVEARQCVMHA